MKGGGLIECQNEGGGGLIECQNEGGGGGDS